MLLKFKAIKETGETIEGVREAADRLVLAREMRLEGITLIKADAVTNTKTGLFAFDNLFKTVKLKEKIIFASNLSSMISAGLSLSRSLDVLERQTSNKYFKSIIKQLLDRVNSGDSFSSALGAFPGVFPDVFTAMVAAGEESGNLPDALTIIKEQLSKTYDLQRKIKGAMIYPIVIISAMIIVGVLMMIFMVPTLTATFKDLNVELPMLTRIVIWVSDFMTNHVVLVLLGMVGAVAGLVYGLRTARGKKMLNFVVLRLPVIGTLAKEVNSAVTMRTISSLISSGVSMVETIRITEKVLQNFYYKKVIGAAADKIQQGISLSAIFKEEEKLFPIMVGELVMVGEETGELPGMLLKGAVFYEEEVNQATKNLSTIIEPVLMMVIGVAVAFFAIAILSPMYSLTNAI